MNTPPLWLYQEEFATVKASLLATCRDLVRDLNAQDRHVEAMAVDEAQLYLRATFKSLERTIATATHGHGDRALHSWVRFNPHSDTCRIEPVRKAPPADLMAQIKADIAAARARETA